MCPRFTWNSKLCWPLSGSLCLVTRKQLISMSSVKPPQFYIISHMKIPMVCMWHTSWGFFKYQYKGFIKWFKIISQIHDIFWLTFVARPSYFDKFLDIDPCFLGGRLGRCFFGFLGCSSGPWKNEVMCCKFMYLTPKKKKNNI